MSASPSQFPKRTHYKAGHLSYNGSYESDVSFMWGLALPKYVLWVKILSHLACISCFS
jgi:hypothetical protein